ncbi:MAG: CsoR family transcriptional regulator, copper-sensing transcriptional repressor, partial [Thermoleophilaceae bacterium]|nr:CsoR family transcriptional regulator, copper-sensing transcriptional repressor [Thermoleophilaceae bacterium]
MTATQSTTTPARGYSENKDQLLTRLRRIEGQTRGIQKMVDEDRWCPDIL